MFHWTYENFQDIQYINLFENGPSDARHNNTIPVPPMLEQLANTLVQIRAFPSSYPPNYVFINKYKDIKGYCHIPMETFILITLLASVLQEVTSSFISQMEQYQTSKTITMPCKHNCRTMDHSLSSTMMHIPTIVIPFMTGYMIWSSMRNCVNAPLGHAVHRGHRISLTFRHKF